MDHELIERLDREEAVHILAGPTLERLNELEHVAQTGRHVEVVRGAIGLIEWRVKDLRKKLSQPNTG